MQRIAAVALAAGRSQRFCLGPKLLHPQPGGSMLELAIRTLRESGLQQIIFVTGHQFAEIEAVLNRERVKHVYNPDYARGMHTSIACGVQTLQEDIDGFFVFLCDQPQVNASTIRVLKEAAFRQKDKSLFVPVHAGQRGNPCLLHRRYIPEILNEPANDRGCHYLFARHEEEVAEVPCDAGVTADIDFASGIL